MSDYAQTLREMRAANTDLAIHKFTVRYRRNDPFADEAAAERVDIRQHVANARAIDAALCALRIVKPELSLCLTCGKRCMVDYDFCDTEVCGECVTPRCPECGHDLEDSNCDNCDEVSQ